MQPSVPAVGWGVEDATFSRPCRDGFPSNPFSPTSHNPVQANFLACLLSRDGHPRTAKRARNRIWTSEAYSGGRFECRMTLGWPRAAALRAPRRPSAGIRGLRWSSHDRQESPKTPQDAGRGQSPRLLRTFPGQSRIGDDGTRQSKLGVGGQDQPAPTVGLLGVAHPRCRPSQSLFHKAYGVFEVEPATVCLPE